jgi:chorismate-pyruvate lyase
MMPYLSASAPLRAVLVGLGCVLAVPADAPRAETQAPAAQEAELIDRLEIYALLQTINAELLASTSATLTLESWCREHGLATDPRIVAQPAGGAEEPVTAEQRQRLRIDAGEPVRYRKVRLACGSKVLSEADNWYVPGRLTPAMNEALERTDTPFGKAIQPLNPFRRTFAAHLLWSPLPEGWELEDRNALAAELERDGGDAASSLPTYVIEHQALVLRQDNLPISEVRERYRSDLLAFRRP